MNKVIRTNSCSTAELDELNALLDSGWVIEQMVKFEALQIGSQVVVPSIEYVLSKDEYGLSKESEVLNAEPVN